MRLKWHRKYWRPWGYTIGYHDECYTEFGRISKHYTKSGCLKFYSFVRRVSLYPQGWAESGFDPNIFRSRSLAVALDELKLDYERAVNILIERQKNGRT